VEAIWSSSLGIVEDLAMAAGAVRKQFQLRAALVDAEEERAQRRDHVQPR
jgi:hypothetical protein